MVENLRNLYNSLRTVFLMCKWRVEVVGLSAAHCCSADDVDKGYHSNLRDFVMIIFTNKHIYWRLLLLFLNKSKICIDFGEIVGQDNKKNIIYFISTEQIFMAFQRIWINRSLGGLSIHVWILPFFKVSLF